MEYNVYLKMVNKVREITDFKPEIAIVLGTGLGEFADNIKIVSTINYKEIPNLPTSTNPDHKGRFVFGYFKDIPVVLMQGRLHCYEGFNSEEATRPIRLMHLLGANKIILTNAVGGINTKYHPGDFMIIDDHIDCFMPSPLIGKNIDEFGPRFPDMSNPYSSEINEILYKKVKEENLPVHKGVFIQYSGPQFETKALIRAMRTLGADACGMSTAIEAVVSNHMGMKTMAISFISNMACGILDKKITNEEVIEEANKSKERFTKLLSLAIEIFHKN